MRPKLRLPVHARPPERAVVYSLVFGGFSAALTAQGGSGLADALVIGSTITAITLVAYRRPAFGNDPNNSRWSTEMRRSQTIVGVQLVAVLACGCDRDFRETLVRR